MASKVFISYRRDDSAGHAGRVHDRLEREFGRDLLFMDVDAIPLGADFIEVLAREVAKCDVLLAIMGPGWLDARDEAGTRRLDSEHDFVRIEIATALQRGIPVIPILLEGTRVPKAEQLPDDLKGLVRRNGLDVRHVSFHSDMDRLVRGLKGPATPLAQSHDSTAAQPAAPQPVITSVAKPAAALVERQPLPPVSSDSDLARKIESGEVLGLISVEVGMPGKTETKLFMPGGGKTEWFQDFEHGPDMVVVPSGSFTMGEGATQNRVEIAEPFAVGRFAVIFHEWDAAVASGVIDHKPDDKGWGRGRRPVINVSWFDANAYASWLSQISGKRYRLLSEAEWEYCCRAGTATAYATGDTIARQQAQFSEGETGSAKQTVEAGSFAPNSWGLFDMHGNVWEWCEDACGATSRVLRGGSWNGSQGGLRSADRNWDLPDYRGNDVGFRVARTL